MQNSPAINSTISPLWNSITLESMVKFCVIYFFVVWIGLIIWVARDISFRTNNRLYQVICILIMISLTPLGIFIYLLIRPRRSMYDKCSAEIEGNLEILSSIVKDRIDTSEDTNSIEDISTILCPECDGDVQEDFIICPHCKTSLKDTCHECHKIIRESWKVCPYCETKQKKKKDKNKKNSD